MSRSATTADVYDLPELAVRPVPPTRIPVLVGGSAERRSAAPRASPTGSSRTPRLRGSWSRCDWVLDECERIGRDPATFRFIHYSVLLPGASRDGGARPATVTRSGRCSGSTPTWGPRRRRCRRRRHRRSIARTRRAREGPVVLRRDPRRARRGRARHPEAGRGAGRVRRTEFFPLLEYDAQVDLMQQLSEGVAPHV